MPNLRVDKGSSNIPGDENDDHSHSVRGKRAHTVAARPRTRVNCLGKLHKIGAKKCRSSITHIVNCIAHTHIYVSMHNRVYYQLKHTHMCAN